MSEFNAGRQGPWPSDNRAQAASDHVQEVREEAEHAHEAKQATRERRRRWWPFGRREAGEAQDG